MRGVGMVYKNKNVIKIINFVRRSRPKFLFYSLCTFSKFVYTSHFKVNRIYRVFGFFSRDYQTKQIKIYCTFIRVVVFLASGEKTPTTVVHNREFNFGNHPNRITMYKSQATG